MELKMSTVPTARVRLSHFLGSSGYPIQVPGVNKTQIDTRVQELRNPWRVDLDV